METSAYLEPDIGEQGEINMKRKIIYTEAPEDVSRAITEGKVVADFLPSPDKLIRKKKTLPKMTPAKMAPDTGRAGGI
jgi:hypothetical protein